MASTNPVSISSMTRPELTKPIEPVVAIGGGGKVLPVMLILMESSAKLADSVKQLQESAIKKSAEATYLKSLMAWIQQVSKGGQSKEGLKNAKALIEKRLQQKGLGTTESGALTSAIFMVDKLTTLVTQLDKDKAKLKKLAKEVKDLAKLIKDHTPSAGEWAEGILGFVCGIFSGGSNPQAQKLESDLAIVIGAGNQVKKIAPQITKLAGKDGKGGDIKTLIDEINTMFSTGSSNINTKVTSLGGQARADINDFKGVWQALIAKYKNQG